MLNVSFIFTISWVYFVTRFGLFIFWFWTGKLWLLREKASENSNASIWMSIFFLLSIQLIKMSKIHMNLLSFSFDERSLYRLRIRYIFKKWEDKNSELFTSENGQKSINYQHKLSLALALIKIIYIMCLCTYLCTYCSCHFLLYIAWIVFASNWFVGICVYVWVLNFIVGCIPAFIHTHAHTFCPFLPIFMWNCIQYKPSEMRVCSIILIVTISSHFYLLLLYIAATTAAAAQNTVLFVVLHTSWKVIIQCAHEFPSCICSIQNHQCSYKHTHMKRFLLSIFATISSVDVDFSSFLRIHSLMLQFHLDFLSVSKTIEEFRPLKKTIKPSRT